MNPEITLHDRTLVWAGQHWINAIRPDGQDQPSGWFSLFATHYGPAGEGNAAQIVIPSGPKRFTARMRPSASNSKRWRAMPDPSAASRTATPPSSTARAPIGVSPAPGAGAPSSTANPSNTSNNRAAIQGLAAQSIRRRREERRLPPLSRSGPQLRFAG